MPKSSLKSRENASDPKSKYTEKQKRKAEHIEEGYTDKGVSEGKAAQIAWATVNKQSGGGEKSGSGTRTSEKEKANARKDSAHKAASTRKKAEKPNSFESKTKVVLLEQARKKNIQGRSSMNKQELIMALRRSGQKTQKTL